MVLSPAQIARIRVWVGSSPDDQSLTALADLFGSERETAQAVLGQRLADLTASARTVTIEGEYSTSTPAAVLAELRAQIGRLGRQNPSLTGEIPADVVAGGRGDSARLVRPGNRR